MPHKNLFSTHYLETRLPALPEWAEDPAPAYAALHDLWTKAQAYGATWNEAQTEAEFIQPALEMLGWAYIVQSPVHYQGRVTRPDYALFAADAARDAAYPLQDDEAAFYARALAIAEAKYWERPLSKQDTAERAVWQSRENPSHQMVSYLVGTRAPWGILTNGRVWRLYSREVSSTASEFYEVDLADIFAPAPETRADTMAPVEQVAIPAADAAGEDTAAMESRPTNVPDAFKRFWLFFRRAAFVPDRAGMAFVQRVRDGSATYAREISDKLKELVFAEVVPEIAGGFVAYRRGELGIAEETAESLREVYQATLSLLYKLLFVLYAEARGLLPVAHAGYWAQSLTKMAREIAASWDSQLPLSTSTYATPRYHALLALFRRIDQGDPSLAIPRYNGGLFNPATPENRFLETHRLSDYAVARAVDLLVRDAGEPVDYAYISVRNLGAIYEGLLENKLVVKPEGSSETLRVSLVNDKGERKASGSYYTPDYIVAYIVEQTLEPLLVRRAAQFAAALDEGAAVRGELAHTADTRANKLLREKLARAERAAREAFLGLKVCDPAMGSGHFLVNAVDFLTDKIIHYMEVYHAAHPDVPPAWNPILRLIATVRAQIMAEMTRQGIAVDAARLDDTALLTRLVLKRCIYGVDLNPLAVELAKLSLWLHSFTTGAPLSFLDHHLRWGNSLIGSDVRTVERELRAADAAQLGLFAGPFAGLLDLTALMTEVVEQADATLADVQASAAQFAQFRAELTPYKQVVDLWVSRHFGNARAYEFLTLYGAEVLPALRGAGELAPEYRAAIDRARELGGEKRFFHWDLEFPEAFIDLARRDWAENPGFDAVIGNPPYGFITDKPTQTALATQYVAVSGYDVYIPFFERGIEVTKTAGFTSYIAPTSWQTGFVYRDLREYVLKTCHIPQIVNLPYDIFREAYIDTSIYLLKKQRGYTEQNPLLESTVSIHTFGKRKKVDNDLLAELDCEQILTNRWFNDAGLRFVTKRGVLALREKLANLPTVLLEEITDSTRGVLPRSSELKTSQIDAQYKPYFDGNLYRYELNWKLSTWVKYTPELREIPSNYKYFDGPRLLMRRLINRRFRLMASYTEDEFVNKKDIYNLIITAKEYNELAILAILNSKLLSYLYVTQSMVATRDDFPQVTLAELRKLPIREIKFTTLEPERAAYLTDARAQYAALEYAALEDRAAQHLAAGRTDVVHDLLAFLAEQMIALHEEKQKHLRGFRLDLAGYLDEPQLQKLNRLYTPKRPPGEGGKNYEKRYARYERQVAAARAHLGALADEVLELPDFWRVTRAQWIWLLRDNLGDVDNLSKLVAVYEQYHAAVAPVMRRIAATDALIDRVVYALYGLTAAEIAVVESNE